MNQGCLWLSSDGQAFMPDFMGSLLVFSIVLSLFLFSWNSVQANQQKFGAEDEIRQDAYYTTTFLVSTPGYPADWNKSTVDIVGFSNQSDNVMSEEKLREFRDISYERQKDLLKVANFHLIFRNQTGILELNSEDLEFGQKPGDADTIVPVTRNVLVNRSGTKVSAEMRYVVWR